MSTDSEYIKRIADRIAQRVTTPGAGVTSGSGSDALSDVREEIQNISRRLGRIEEQLASGAPQRPTRSIEDSQSQSPWLSGVYVPVVNHPSSEKFAVEEAAVSEMVDFLELEKKCEMEPGGKPCDHCAMCNTRG